MIFAMHYIWQSPCPAADAASYSGDPALRVSSQELHPFRSLGAAVEVCDVFHRLCANLYRAGAGAGKVTAQ